MCRLSLSSVFVPKTQCSEKTEMLNNLPALALDLYARVTARGGRRGASILSRRTVGDQVLVPFPFTLKDLFKWSFPSTQWDPDRRCWTIPKEQSERLSEWMRIVEPSRLLNDIRAVERRLHDDQEIIALRTELDRLRDEIRTTLEQTIANERRRYAAGLSAEIASLKHDFARLSAGGPAGYEE